MLVADSCGDPNAWCRDDPVPPRPGAPGHRTCSRRTAPRSGDLEPAHWGNRKVTWEFIEAPNYSGDIQIGFIQGSEKWWGAGVSINHLPNGIHGVEHFTDGAWGHDPDEHRHGAVVPGEVDHGRAGPTTGSGSRTSPGRYIFGGREYSFSLPSSCGGKCLAPRTVVTYTTAGGDTSTPTPTPTPSPTVTPTATENRRRRRLRLRARRRPPARPCAPRRSVGCACGPAATRARSR